MKYAYLGEWNEGGILLDFLFLFYFSFSFFFLKNPLNDGVHSMIFISAEKKE